MRARTRRHRGLFITLEGPEGSGKSTQIGHLAAALRRAGYKVVATREPGGTPVAEAIRNVLLLSKQKEPIGAKTEALLILAARSQHVTHVIKPALLRGAVVLCDRYSDSTLAYQGFGRGLDRDWLKQTGAIATDGLQPDLTLLLDLPVTVGLARRCSSSSGQNRLDRETVRFHRVVRQGFLRLAEQSRGRIKVIRADRSEEEIRAELEPLALRWAARYVGRRRRVHAVS
jgi:dTMP kinase